MYVSKDGKNFFWMVYDNISQQLIMNPTRRELAGAKIKKYNQTNVCSICRKKWENRKDDSELAEKSLLYPNNSVRGQRTEEWVCKNHSRESVMYRYRESVSFDCKNFFDILIDNGKLIMNPDEENLKDTMFKRYNLTNICPICRDELKAGNMSELTERSILYPKNALRRIDENGKKTTEWVCKRHHAILYQRYDTLSNNNIIKSMTDRRTGNLKDRGNIFADNCQELTCRMFGVEDLNKKNDKYNNPFDHTPIPKGTSIMIEDKLVDLSGKIPQTKGGRYNCGSYGFGNLESEWNKEFDIEILWCVSKDGLTVEREYIIPKKNIYDPDMKKGIKSITIYKNSEIPASGWYTRYRINDEKELRRANIFWMQIICNNKNDQKY